MKTITIGQQTTASTMFRGRPQLSISSPAGHIHMVLRSAEPAWNVAYCGRWATAAVMRAARSGVRWRMFEELARSAMNDGWAKVSTLLIW